MNEAVLGADQDQLECSESSPLCRLIKSHDALTEDDEPDDALQTATVEMFSDLVVAAAISSLSVPLTASVPNTVDWLWFWLQVFFVWGLWNNCLMLNDIVDLYGGDVKNVELGILMHVFATVFLMVCLVQFSLHDKFSVAAIIFIFARHMLLVLGRIESGLKPRQSSTQHIRYENFQKGLRLAHILIPLECSPLIIAVLFYRDTQFGLLVGGYTSAAAYILLRRIFARKLDFSPTYVQSEDHVVDLNHIRERYEVIAQIFFGRLCFVDCTGFEGKYVSFCALFTAMGGYLLYFVARVRGRTEPWLVSAEASTQYPNLHIMLFLVLPSMAVAFSQIIQDSQTDSSWVIDPHELLYCSSGIFLFILGCMELLAEDPVERGTVPRIPRRYRVVKYFFLGFGLIACGQLSKIRKDSVTVVPIAFTAIATMQIWAVQVQPTPV